MMNKIIDIFPISYCLILSLLNIVNLYRFSIRDYTIITSLIGIIGFTLFILKRKVYEKVLILWILLQLIIISKPTDIKFVEEIVFNLSQVFFFKISLNIFQDKYYFGINIIALLYFFIYLFLISIRKKNI